MKSFVFSIALTVSLAVHAEVRTWTTTSGQQLEAEYEKIVMDNAWLKKPSGDIVKVPLAALSEEDRLYIEMFNPPKLEIDFWDKSDARLGYYKGTPHLDVIPPSVSTHSFRARVRQIDHVEYHHELTVTYYAIGWQLIDRNKCYLIEKKTGSFIPSENPEIELSGSVFKMLKYVFENQNRGRDYAFFLVIVTDDQGKIVAHKESQSWLFKNREKLDLLPEGAFMDTSCTRVHPTGPKPQY